MSRPSLERFLSVATLRRSRALLARPFGRLLAVTVGIVYTLVALLVGQMLVFGREFAPAVYVLTSGPDWWNYPGLLVIAPNAVLSLPFFATVTMAVVAIGVGLGMAVAILLGIQLIRNRRRALGGAAGYASAAGLTPAMIALVTLGACCSTTAVATAGIGVAAQAGGTGFNSVLAHAWYLGVFQMGILWVALLAQEEILEVYGVLFDPERRAEAPPVPRLTSAAWASGLLRLALLAGGVTWSLAMFAEWTTVAPAGAAPLRWLWWIAEHQLLAVFAVLLALFPREVLGPLARSLHRPIGRALRGAVGLAGIVLLGWTPPALAGAGLHGLVNEVLGASGAGAAVGGVVPAVSGLALALRWCFQLGLLGAFGVAFLLAPEGVIRLLGRSVAPDSGAFAAPGPTAARGPVPGPMLVAGREPGDP